MHVHPSRAAQHRAQQRKRSAVPPESLELYNLLRSADVPVTMWDAGGVGGTVTAGPAYRRLDSWWSKTGEESRQEALVGLLKIGAGPTVGSVGDLWMWTVGAHQNQAPWRAFRVFLHKTLRPATALTVAEKLLDVSVGRLKEQPQEWHQAADAAGFVMGVLAKLHMYPDAICRQVEEVLAQRPEHASIPLVLHSIDTGWTREAAWRWTQWRKDNPSAQLGALTDQEMAELHGNAGFDLAYAGALREPRASTPDAKLPAGILEWMDDVRQWGLVKPTKHISDLWNKELTGRHGWIGMWLLALQSKNLPTAWWPDGILMGRALVQNIVLGASVKEWTDAVDLWVTGRSADRGRDVVAGQLISELLNMWCQSPRGRMAIFFDEPVLMAGVEKLLKKTDWATVFAEISPEDCAPHGLAALLVASGSASERSHREYVGQSLERMSQIMSKLAPTVHSTWRLQVQMAGFPDSSEAPMSDILPLHEKKNGPKWPDAIRERWTAEHSKATIKKQLERTNHPLGRVRKM